MKRLPRRAWRGLLAKISPRLIERVFQSWVNVVGEEADDRTALRTLFRVADHVEREIDHAAVRIDGGVHAKHRLTRYHDFFVERIRPGERVLDLGCGKGELAHDIASRAGAQVIAVDRKGTSLAFARSHFLHTGLSFIDADILEGFPPGPFDVVVMSNVLEHLERRVDLLDRIVHELHPRCVLIRVPAEDRHWHVPLRRELGLPWLSDPSHEIEYDRERLLAELDEAGLEPAELEARWGELWVAARPAAHA